MFIRKDEEKTVDGEVEKIPAAINENALNSREKRANNIHYGRTVPQGVCTAKNRKDKYQFDNVQRGEKTRRKHSRCTSHTHARAQTRQWNTEDGKTERNANGGRTGGKNARTLSVGRAATVTSIVSTREKVKEADNAKAGRVRVLLTSKLSNK